MNKLMKKQKKNNKGFSLVELIVVIAIMAVLVGVIAPQFMGYIEKSKKSTDIQNAQSIASALQVAYAESDADLITTGTDTAVSTAIDGITDVPDVKLDSTDGFYYSCTSAGVIKVLVGDGTTNVELYPSVDASYQ